MLEEWRMGRDSAGRAQEAHWQLIMAGCRVREWWGLQRALALHPAQLSPRHCSPGPPAL